MLKIDSIQKLAKNLNISIKDAEIIINTSLLGGEISNEIDLQNWLNQRFLPNCIFINEEGYTKMCINALKILVSIISTNKRKNVERDLFYLWGNLTQKYLGEYAFQLFMKQKWNIESELGHEKGNIQDFLLTDIHKIKMTGETERNPNLKISIKTTKWNGIWLDIPGDQFNHADVHLLVKVGTGRDHLFAFFKRISVFQDKILKRGQDVGVLTKAESDQLYEELPSFSPIPAYICGFVWQNYQYKNLPYSGKMGRKNYTITGWNGAINPNDLEEIKKIESVSGSIKFEGIGSFSHDRGYLFNTGNLLWQEKDWNSFKTKI
jgi:hypothetical protein